MTRTLTPPSHVTKAQASRMLGCAASAITVLVQTEELPVETWWGQPMIPVSAITALPNPPGRARRPSKEADMNRTTITRKGARR